MFDALDFPGNHVLLCMYYFAKELVKEYTEEVRKNDFLNLAFPTNGINCIELFFASFVNIAKGFKVSYIKFYAFV